MDLARPRTSSARLWVATARRPLPGNKRTCATNLQFTKEPSWRRQDARRSVPRHPQGHLLRRKADREGAAENGEGRAVADSRPASRSISTKPRATSSASSRSSRSSASRRGQDLRRDPRHPRGGQVDHGRVQGHAALDAGLVAAARPSSTTRSPATARSRPGRRSSGKRRRQAASTRRSRKKIATDRKLTAACRRRGEPQGRLSCWWRRPGEPLSRTVGLL